MMAQGCAGILIGKVIYAKYMKIGQINAMWKKPINFLQMQSLMMSI